MLGLLRRTRPDAGPRRRLEAEVHHALALGPKDAVRINEISCGGDGCADIVLAMLIMRHGQRTEIHRVERDLASASLADLLDAMRPSVPDPRTKTLTDALAGLTR